MNGEPPVAAGPLPPARRKVSFFAQKRPWLNALLFILTVGTTYFVGLSQSASYVFAEQNPGSTDMSLAAEILGSPRVVLMSLLYTAVLLGILLGHELGHYLACRKYGIDSTLPYFIPFPNLIGTLGAFIKIRSPIQRKHQLFDIGVAGPLTGFFLAVPALVAGLSLSNSQVQAVGEGWLGLGEPLLMKALAALLVPNAGDGYVIHPIAFAGWVGILITSFNLFPTGQLDGGHVAYALLGERSKSLARGIFLIFILLGVFFWAGWFVWAVLIRSIGIKHPPIWDEDAPLSPSRRALGVLIIVIFLLSFIPDPIQGFSLLDILNIARP